MEENVDRYIYNDSDNSLEILSKNNIDINGSLESNDIKRTSNNFTFNRWCWYAIGLGAVSFGVISKL